MKIEIKKIRIAARIRKEVGKIEELAANIREYGLITPIAVMTLDGGEYQLLAGLRRIRAMELNGETEIDAKIFPVSDAETALKIEHSENEQRESFTYSEKMDYAKLIEEIEAEKAIKRKSMGGKGGLTEDVPQGAHLNKGKSRSIIGEKIGMSGTQYDRAKYIAENAPQEIIDELDRGERTIRRTYDELRHKEKSGKQSETQEKTQIESLPEQTPAKLNADKKNSPADNINEENKETIQEKREFDTLTLEEKITELQYQLKKERARATGAESKLSREMELRQNAEYHLGGTIELLDKQLKEARMRIAELEAKYEPGKHIPDDFDVRLTQNEENTIII